MNDIYHTLMIHPRGGRGHITAHAFKENHGCVSLGFRDEQGQLIEVCFFTESDEYAARVVVAIEALGGNNGS